MTGSRPASSTDAAVWETRDMAGKEQHMPDRNDDTALHILGTYRTWAVVGCSPDPGRPSHGVAAFLQAKGYRVIPVNPGFDEILGERCYPDLHSVPTDT